MFRARVYSPERKGERERKRELFVFLRIISAPLYNILHGGEKKNQRQNSEDEITISLCKSTISGVVSTMLPRRENYISNHVNGRVSLNYIFPKVKRFFNARKLFFEIISRCFDETLWELFLWKIVKLNEKVEREFYDFSLFMLRFKN